MRNDDNCVGRRETGIETQGKRRVGSLKRRFESKYQGEGNVGGGSA